MIRKRYCGLKNKGAQMFTYRHLACALIVMALSPMVWAQSHQPYAGQEMRDIKALSPAEIEDYLSGNGMGLAKAAELNHYPGPKHVMELADELQLTADQLAKTQAVYDAMRQEAEELGKQIVNAERYLDRLFASQAITETTLQEHIRKIAASQGQLRLAHLKAHLAQRDILTPQQIAHYDTLRGYGHNGQHDHHHQHRH